MICQNNVSIKSLRYDNSILKWKKILTLITGGVSQAINIY